MLTLKVLRENPEFVISRLAVKNFDAREIVESILALDTRKRALQTESDNIVAQQKVKAAEIGKLMKAGQKEEAEAAKAAVAELKERSNALLSEGDRVGKELEDKLVLLPNLPCSIVPEGKGAEDNLVVKMGGPEVTLPADAVPHWEL